MKLWHIAQWGNQKEGGNGWDTQCVIRANDMQAALAQAEIHFYQNDPNWRDAKADLVILIGDDGLVSDEGPKLIIPIWIKPAFNLGKYQSWHRDYETNEWLDTKAMYGDSDD